MNLRLAPCVLSSVSRTLLAVVLCLLAATAVQAADPPNLVILTPTGQSRDGLPVLTRHPDATAVSNVLTRGFSGRLLRLYAWEQEFLRQRSGRVPEPAYLLLSDRQGGFPQVGFYLDGEKKADAGWVDLHRSSTLSGRFGAMDQIFPHELLHVIVRQLAGEPRESGGNQVHAVGVRTDPMNAFGEGFAEHVQILAVDDDGAVPETVALRKDTAAKQRADAALPAFARDLTRPWWPIRPAQIRFLLWFSQTEQVLRYHAVKANLFARAPVTPAALLDATDKYRAYLYQSVMPGTIDDAARPASVMLSTEGVVAHLFWRLTTNQAIQRRYQDGAFYARFGTNAEAVSPLDNVFLKLFFTLAESRADNTADLVRAYVRLFPADGPDVERVVRTALLGQRVPDAPEVWLANDALMTGTSLFDQFRGLPRPHTFDINAATTLDWLAVGGVTPDQAWLLSRGGPYQDLPALLRTHQLPAPVRQRVTVMAADMKSLLTRAADEEEQLSLWAIALPYLWRLAAVLLAAAGAGAWLARLAGVRRWWTASLIGTAASTAVLALSWVITSPPWYPLAAPVVLGGLPWALWRLVRRRNLAVAFRALLAWVLATIPALLLVRSW
jgi:hypothetical protein